jgi:hypothetical protein
MDGRIASMKLMDGLKGSFRIVCTAYASWSTLLGTVIGAVALSSLVFRLFHVSVFDALALMLVAYQKTFHPPIAFIFSWLPFALPPAAKDLVLLYIAMAGVLFRSLSYLLPKSDMRKQFRRPWTLRARMFAGKIIAAAAWPYFIKSIIARPLLLVRDAQNNDRGRLPHMSRKEAEAFIAGDSGGAAVFCDERELVICYFVALFVAVLAIVLLNAAVNDLEARFS